MEFSKLRLRTVGIVARAKPRGSSEIEFFGIEMNPAAHGEVTDNVDLIEVKGKSGAGKEFEGTLTTTASLTATWLPLGDPNRVTPPDVQRNEYVFIYQYGDVNDKYYWVTSMNAIRMLETALWWFSGTTDPDTTERTDENGYLLMISTHDKKVIFSTSDVNGEVCRYFIQMDTANGTLTIQDNLGQEISFDSMAGRIFMKAEEKIELKTKLIQFHCEVLEVNASEKIDLNTPVVNISDKLIVGGHTLLESTSIMKGRSNFQGGIGGTNPEDLSSPIDFYGTVNQIGNWNAKGNVSVTGDITATGDVSWPGRPF